MSAIGQTGTVGTPSAPPEGGPPSTGQAPQPGTEQGQPQQPQAGFWGRFPTVPQEQRAALEPHLKTVQAYVTRLEQAYVAPFKGYTPQQVQGLATFAKSFDANPLQVFLSIANQLQSSGVIHENLDLNALAAVVQGQDPPEDEEVVTPPDGGQGADDPWADAPPWALEIRAREQAQEQQQQEQSRVQAEAREKAVLDVSIKGIKTKLEAAGFPKDSFSDKDITARFIVHNGSAEAVMQDLQKLRTGLLQGAVTPNNETVDLPRGVPPTGRTATQRRAASRPGDSFAKASASAEQFMRQASRAAQQ